MICIRVHLPFAQQVRRFLEVEAKYFQHRIVFRHIWLKASLQRVKKNGMLVHGR